MTQEQFILEYNSLKEKARQAHLKRRDAEVDTYLRGQDILIETYAMEISPIKKYLLLSYNDEVYQITSITPINIGTIHHFYNAERDENGKPYMVEKNPAVDNSVTFFARNINTPLEELEDVNKRNELIHIFTYSNNKFYDKDGNKIKMTIVDEDELLNKEN